jgi:spermidine/putrescine-binding protein
MGVLHEDIGAALAGDGGVPARRLGRGSGAEAQKKLVVYTSNESTLNDLVFGAFTKETGIQVEPVRQAPASSCAACRPRKNGP